MTGGDAAGSDKADGIGGASGIDRRRLLSALATAGAGGLAGCSLLESGADALTRELDDDSTRRLAERFAPVVVFDENERWFPTDPRPYATDRDGRRVVPGFAALDGYVRRRREGDGPPDPTAFYHGVRYEDSPLAVVQYWFYSAFDQFTTNFHWHDWEVLHVFLDLADAAGGDADGEGTIDPAAADPVLYVASSHSRRVPNNEHLDPDRPPRVLAELGSHSSALSVNDRPNRFDRLPGETALADVTNGAIEGIQDLAGVPIAYGLPRDEGSRLPYLVPELDGRPLYEDDRLPAVERSDLVPPELTIRSFDALRSPPTDLPARSTGTTFGYAGASGDGEDGEDATTSGSGGGTADGDGGSGEFDVAYDLAPTADLEQIEAFTGPQLSFEFGVPKVGEDLIASHVTATGVPWQQDRYDAPAADVSDPDHRTALASRYDAIGEPSPVDRVIARVSQAVTSEDAPDGEGLTTRESPVEAVALLESDPRAQPTFLGVVAADLPADGGDGDGGDANADDHRLTIEGPGLAPHSERVSVGSDAGSDATGATDGDAGGDGTAEGDATGGTDRKVTVAGVDGEVPLVARESAVKLEVDPTDSAVELSAVAVVDDFAGRLYDAPADGPEAVYVHRGGAYAAEVRDADGEVGAVRVNPEVSDDGDGDDDDGDGPGNPPAIRIDDPQTGAGSLAMYLGDLARETRDAVAAVADDDGPGGGDGGPGNAVRGLARALAAVAEAADRAAERAAAGDRGGVDRALQSVQTRLDTVADRLSAARGSIPDDLGRAVDRRLTGARRRADQAADAGTL